MTEAQLRKLKADGIATTGDGYIWINKEKIKDGNTINFNKVVSHEITHQILGEDSEYEARYVESGMEEFLSEIKGNGYLKDGKIIDLLYSRLTDEDRARLNRYVLEDMQFSEEVDGVLVNSYPKAEKRQLREIDRKNNLQNNVNKRIKNDKRLDYLYNKKNLTKKESKELTEKIAKIRIEEAYKVRKNEVNNIIKDKEITVTHPYFRNEMKRDKNNKLVVYAGGQDYNRLVKEIKEKGLESQVKVEYKEKIFVDVMTVINKETAKKGQVPSTWTEEERQELEKIRGKKVGYFDENSLIGEKKLTEKEVGKYTNFQVMKEIYETGKIVTTGYFVSKYGNTNVNKDVTKINTKTEIMGQKTVFINDGTPQGTVKAIQTVSGNPDITQLRTYIPQTGETIIRTRINATGDIFENVLYNTGSSISGAAQKPLAQIENSVYNTFGDISKPVVTGKVSSNNLLAEYSVKPNNIPALYNPNYATFQKGDYLNSIRVVNRDGSSNIPKGQGFINVDNRPYLNGSRPSFRKDFAQNLYNYYNGVVKDPNTGEIIDWKPGQPRKGVVDFGHMPDQKYSDVFEKYRNENINPKEFREWYNNVENYQFEKPGNNRSHKYE